MSLARTIEGRRTSQRRWTILRFLPPSAGGVSRCDYALLLGSLVIVFGAMGLFGLIRPDIGPRKVERRQRIRKRKKQPVIQTPSPVEEDDGDIQFEDEQDDLLEEMVEFDDDTEQEVIEEVEEKPIPLDDFEARLERLRERRDRLGGE